MALYASGNMPKDCAIVRGEQASSALRQRRSRSAHLLTSLAAASQPCLLQSSYVTLAALLQLRWDPTHFCQIFSITWPNEQVTVFGDQCRNAMLWVVSVMTTFRRRASGNTTADMLRNTTTSWTCTAANSSWMHSQRARPLARWQFHCQHHLAAQGAKRQMVHVLEGKHGH